MTTLDNFLSTEPEKVYMPENANYKEWLKTDEEGSYLPYPSQTQYDLFYKIRIGENNLLRCNCKGFKFKGFCSHVKKLRWVCKKKTRNTSAVSLEAKLSQSSAKMAGDFIKILNELKRYPRTCDELEIVLGMIHQTCAARISNLFYMGYIESTGEERKTRTGRKAIVWMVS